MLRRNPEYSCCQPSAAACQPALGVTVPASANWSWSESAERWRAGATLSVGSRTCFGLKTASGYAPLGLIAFVRASSAASFQPDAKAEMKDLAQGGDPKAEQEKQNPTSDQFTHVHDIA